MMTESSLSTSDQVSRVIQQTEESFMIDNIPATQRGFRATLNVQDHTGQFQSVQSLAAFPQAAEDLVGQMV